MRKIIAIALIAAFATPVGAFAADMCSVPQDKWMTEDALKAKAVEMGYDVKKVKIEKGCYEIYAIDKDGNKVEVLMNPETAAVVEVKEAM